MPKLKTRKSIAKRLKQTASGKYMRTKPGKSHILTKKSSKRKANLKKQSVLKKSELSKVKSALPYGIK